MRLLNEAHDQAERILLEHRDLLDRLSALLLVTETIDGDGPRGLHGGHEADPGRRASSASTRSQGARVGRGGRGGRGARSASREPVAGAADRDAAGAADAHGRLTAR